MPDPMRSARTFRPRRRGLPPQRAADFERDAARFVLSVTGGPIDLATVFPDHADVVLDVGFGGGEALVELAVTRPHEAVLGIEVHTPGVARVVAAAALHDWSHVRVVPTDVLEVLPRLALGSLAGVRIWFPDPWPKQRQRHRRLVRADVMVALVDRVRVGGVVHVATDVADYAEQVLAVAAAEGRLVGGRIDRPAWRPVTRFEARGLREGRTAADLWFTRTA
ncbi:MAG: tRNA (guanosine(46)-N7)-methyltransferase TrmB [Ilumatobacteraceae bacterium]